MANKYFTQLTQITAGSVASGDAFAIEDISGGETKYIVASDVATYVSSTLAGASGGWDAVSDTWAYLGTYTGGGTVSIPAGGTLLYGKGDKIKFVQGGTQLYFYAIDVGGTTLKITGGSDYTLGTAAISSIYYSKTENPLDFPDWFNYTVVHGGFSANPTYVARFNVSGKQCTVGYYPSVSGTSNANNYSITLPITAKTVSGYNWYTCGGYTVDNTAAADQGLVTIASGATSANLYKSAFAVWTTSGLKSMSLMATYEI